MNIDYINPFIEASQTVLRQIASINAKLGKVYLKDSPYKSDSILILVGLTGSIRGQAIFSMSRNLAMSIASSMMFGMPVVELDEISISAISELTNMILGNAATLLYNRGTSIEITPPSLLMGDNMTISQSKMKTVCVPLLLENDGVIELDISIESEL
ncbi:MAG: chemotaxis protein CheX [Ruminiclostridium sp.]|nr:chemotaxis protein CheX [Ruminiclostridium sp.]